MVILIYSAGPHRKLLNDLGREIAVIRRRRKKIKIKKWAEWTGKVEFNLVEIMDWKIFKKPILTLSWLTFLLSFSCCFTSTEAIWPIRDGDRVGRGWQSESSTVETIRKRPERPWTATRTMEVLRQCPLAIAQWLVHCSVAVSTAVLDRVTKTMSVAPLLTNNLDNLKQKMSNLLSPAPPPYSWSLLGKF